MSQNCRCRKFAFETATKKPTPEYWLKKIQANEMWFCASCGLPHHAVQEPIRLVRGPLNAKALLHASLHKDGTQTLTWSMGDGQPTVDTIEYATYPRTIGMTDTEPRIFKLWSLLQEKVEVIVDNKPELGRDDTAMWMNAKAQARGVAECLHILMHPFMDSPDDVVRHAVKFYKDNNHEVPGLGAHLWDPFRNPDGTPRTAVSSPKTRTAVKAPAPKPTKTSLSPEEVAGIKNAVESGMFSKEDMCSMFKCSMEVLESALSTSTSV